MRARGEEREERPRVHLVIPARDEEEALPLVLAELPVASLDRVVVVDNGSRDGTARAAAEWGAEVVGEERPGYGNACLAGIARLAEPAPDGRFAGAPPAAPEDVVVFLDADHSDHPSELPRVAGPVLDGRADFVVGSRVLGGASAALLPQARFGNRLACALVRILHGARWTDLGPFRAIRASALERLGMRDRDFGWTIEMQLKATAAGLRAVEVPVSYRARIGRSKITGTVRGTVLAGWKIVGWILLWRFRGVSRRPRAAEAARAGSRAAGSPRSR